MSKPDKDVAGATQLSKEIRRMEEERKRYEHEHEQQAQEPEPEPEDSSSHHNSFSSMANMEQIYAEKSRISPSTTSASATSASASASTQAKNRPSTKQQQREQQQQHPGAYLVQGDSILRAESGVHSVSQQEAFEDDGPSHHRYPKERRFSKKKESLISLSMPISSPDQHCEDQYLYHHHGEPSSPALQQFQKDSNDQEPPLPAHDTSTTTDTDTTSTTAPVVIAAQLSADAEAQLEDRLRGRLLEETAQASVVWIEPPEPGIKSLLSSSPSSSNHHRSNSAVSSGSGISNSNINSNKKSNNNKHRSVKEKLFGDARGKPPDISKAPDKYIRRRSQLPWTVHFNETTQQWVARVQTSTTTTTSHEQDQDQDQEDERYIQYQYYSASSQIEAYEIGLAMVPPKYQESNSNNSKSNSNSKSNNIISSCCFLCKSTFAVFRRPTNCRNCGVCICKSNSCCTTWPSKMLPETYTNITTTTSTSTTSNNGGGGGDCNVCLACDWLAKQFRQALLEGDATKVSHLYATGNVNLRTPYHCGVVEKNNKKVEIMHPIHMAIVGGNLTLVQWLVLERCCPLVLEKDPTKQHHQLQGRGATATNSSRVVNMIVTSKGRSPVRLALSNIKILRFLVAQQGLSLMDESDLDYSTLLAHLTLLLQTVQPRALTLAQRTQQRQEQEQEQQLVLLNPFKNNNNSSSTTRKEGVALVSRHRSTVQSNEHAPVAPTQSQAKTDLRCSF